MANVADVAIVFSLLYPDIEILYANPETIDEPAMNLIPQWRGVRAVFLTVEHKILQGVRVHYPLSQTINENGIMQTLIDVPVPSF